MEANVNDIQQSQQNNIIAEKKRSSDAMPEIIDSQIFDEELKFNDQLVDALKNKLSILDQI